MGVVPWDGLPLFPEADLDALGGDAANVFTAVVTVATEEVAGPNAAAAGNTLTRAAFSSCQID